ncbi:MAG: tetratricopeptide repeat protein [Verrucomicrobia bacterium]|nr:tetratricopeptide repeat protein [Verrucomicrobiota bacterium]
MGRGREKTFKQRIDSLDFAAPPIVSAEPYRSPSPAGATPGRQAVWFAGGLLVLIAVIAYRNSFSGPFVYDDVPAIVENPTIRKLWPLWEVLAPPSDSGVTVNGRPVVNLSLALNYAAGGTAVRGYHAVNLCIHGLAGLVLFGLVRRTLLSRGVPAWLRNSALPVAASSAALWMAHPLQTESVTYVIQRAESLVGLFYLATLYFFVRGASSPGRAGWHVACVAACLSGMGSKEVMASAPVLVLLLDRAFVSGSFLRAWREHRCLYVALGCTWLVLLILVLNTGNRGGTAGFGAGGMAWWAYAFMQCRAIVHYLWLAIWPNELVFDYGIDVETNFLAIWPQFIAITGLVGGVCYTAVRHPRLGFPLMFFLAVLAPSSSIIPIATETMAEHRMYLPLAAVAVVFCVTLRTLTARRPLALTALMVLGLATMTARRNRDYQDELVLWTDTARKAPGNSRAHNNVGEILFRRDRPAEAVACFQEAIRLLPNYVDAINNLGNVLTQTGRAAEALPLFERALKLKPNYAETLTNYGNALFELGDENQAAALFEQAIKLKPGFASPKNNLGVILAKRGRAAEAIVLYQDALRLKPDYADAHYNFGNALAESGKTEAAIQHFKEALRLKPKYPEVLNNLGKAVYLLDRFPEAIAHYETALAQRPDFADAHNNYAAALYRVGRVDDAVKHLKRAIELRPDYTDAKSNLAWILAQPKTPTPPDR